MLDRDLLAVLEESLDPESAQPFLVMHSLQLEELSYLVCPQEGVVLHWAGAEQVKSTAFRSVGRSLAIDQEILLLLPDRYQIARIPGVVDSLASSDELGS